MALEDRLWIQRIPPKPAKSLKRKRTAEDWKVSPTEQHKRKSSKKRRADANTTQEKLSQRTGSGRAAKLQAKIKLDAQTKEFATSSIQARGTRQIVRLTEGSTKRPARPQGTRVSARLRGAQNQWQCIPAEWMNETPEINHECGRDEKKGSPARNITNGARDDSVSELTELSDESNDLDAQLKNQSQHQPDRFIQKEKAENLTEIFLEWETVSFLGLGRFGFPTLLI